MQYQTGSAQPAVPEARPPSSGAQKAVQPVLPCSRAAWQPGCPDTRMRSRVTLLVQAIFLDILAQQIAKLLHLVRNWSVKGHQFTGDRMLKLDMAGVQSLVPIVV